MNLTTELGPNLAFGGEVDGMDYERAKGTLLRLYHRWRGVVPAKLLYHPDHFAVRRLLAAPPEVQRAAAEHRLRHVLGSAVAYVPWYRRRVTLRPVELAHAPVAELLERFPYIGKQDVMECQRDFVDDRVNPRFLVYAQSHGSSGTGIGVWRDKRQGDIEKAFYFHAWGRLGFSFDKSRYARLGADSARPLDDAPCYRFGNRLMVSPNHLQAAHKADIVAALNRFRPEFIHAYPSAALSLAELLAPGELQFRLKGVLLASEPATAVQLALIGRVFDCPVSISYGLTERTNLAFAHHQRGHTSAYQFEPLYGWNETRLTSDGQPEIVGTSAWNEVMPLIRYCTGDFADIDERGQCPEILGRVHEFVLDRDGNRLPGLTIALEAATWDFVRSCQIRQREPGKLTIAVVPRNGPLTPEQKAELLAAPLQHWGSRFEMDVAEVPELARAPGGKRQFVVNDFRAAG